MLSIIIPTLNEEKYLPKLLQSIKSQNFDGSYEIIVSDGDSEDRTKNIAKNYDCRLTVSKKRSPAHQRNEGAKIARGEILFFLDADTMLPKNDFLQKTLKEFKKRNLDVASFYLKLNSKKLIYKILSSIGRLIWFAAQFFKPLSLGASIIVKNEYHKKVNGFDESLFIGEDHNYSQTIRKKGGKFRLIKSKKILYSTRRFEEEGQLKTLLKWIYASLYYLIKGPIRKKIVEYEFGKY